jgi:DNA-binding MarR family transcriptional regulator
MGTNGTPKSTDLMMLLQLTTHALETELQARLAEIEITPRASCVLTSALQAERTQSELAEMANLDKTTMVVTMDALEKAGLAERRLSSTDRRARIIVVTEEGRDIVAKAQQVIADVYEDVLGSLPADLRAGLLGGLSALVEGRLAEPAQCERPPRRRALRQVVS